MAIVVNRIVLLAAALAALVGAEAVRFGDRLAPRVSAAHAPRHASSASQQDDADYEESYENDNEEIIPHSTENEYIQPEIVQSPRRPSRTEAHRLEMSTEYFVVPERRSTSTTSVPKLIKVKTEMPPLLQPINITESPTATLLLDDALRSETWAVPVLALSCICMAILGGFEAFIIWGATRTPPSRRHLLLGQSLLFGLFSCAATAALYSATPTAFICGAVRFGTGVAYVVVFASLLVKCVFLLSLNGGVYLPAAYQGLLLFFSIMIQVAIGAQWLGGSPPKLTTDGKRCGSPMSDMLMSLCYAAFLIVIVCGVALRSRGIRDNYREATHIAGAGGATAAVWVCWVAAALGAPDRHKDACLAAGLLGTCTVVFALMFAPKGRRLAALGRDGRWDADRDERLSSLGAGGSGYSPSFFHFKPVKYGMVSAATAAPAAPPVPDRKEMPSQPADPFGAMWFGSPYTHARSMCPPPHYPMHSLTHYPFNYSPYHYLLPPGVMLRPDDGNVYTTVEPTFSSNPNVFFQRQEPLHVGMMY